MNCDESEVRCKLRSPSMIPYQNHHMTAGMHCQIHIAHLKLILSTLEKVEVILCYIILFPYETSVSHYYCI